MIADRRFRATCKGCGVRFDLFHYEGLHRDSRMGNHVCAKKKDYMKLFTVFKKGSFVRNLKEAKLEKR